MGIKIQVGDYLLQASDYSVEEAATPLAAGDSTGGVGSISFTVPAPDPNLRGTPITDYGPWTTQRINLFRDPLATSTDSAYWGTSSATPLSTVSDGFGTWVRSTRSGTGNLRILDMKAGTSLSPSTSYRVRVRVRASVSLTGVQFNYRPVITSTADQVSITGLTIPAGESDFEITLTTSAATTTSTSGFTFVQAGPAGATLDAQDVEVETSSTVASPSVIPGAAPDTDTSRTIWSGTPNSSTSLYQTRTSDVNGFSYQDTAWRAITTYGPDILLDLPVTLTDSRKGFTLGTVIGATRVDDQGTLQVACESRLANLNAYGVRAAPFVGTLEEAFEYYLGLAGITVDLFVDDSIASRSVVFPGWTGELWYHLKQMAVAQDCDISLVSGVILLRPIRVRVATPGRDASRSRNLSTSALAQAVEVYRYDNRAITNQLVYPRGGWTPEVEVMNVNAGETSEYVWDLSASVSSIQAPVMQTFVSESYSASSVYTVVANDGLPVSPTAWSQYGGSLTVSIEPDTRRIRVSLRGAVGLPTSEGVAATQFSIGLASDTTGNRYSTFRIVGTGVAFTRTKKRIRTGVPASRTATEIGVTIDNPFISTVDDLYRAGTRAAKQYAGQVPSLTGTVTSINRRGDSGQAEYPKYGEVQDALYDELGSPTYSDVQTYYTSLGLLTYESVRQYWFDFVRDDLTNQVFGNINGARVYDKASRRWYRIRTGTASADVISFTAEDDLTHEDVELFYLAKTYGDLDLILSNLTYKQADLVGLHD